MYNKFVKFDTHSVIVKGMHIIIRPKIKKSKLRLIIFIIKLSVHVLMTVLVGCVSPAQ